MPQKPLAPPPTPLAPARVPAAHVQAANVKAAQAKLPQGPAFVFPSQIAAAARPVAPHVQSTLARAAQAKIPQATAGNLPQAPPAPPGRAAALPPGSGRKPEVSGRTPHHPPTRLSPASQPAPPARLASLVSENQPPPQAASAKTAIQLASRPRTTKRGTLTKAERKRLEREQEAAAERDRKNERKADRKSHFVGTRQYIGEKWEEDKNYFDPIAKVSVGRPFGTGAPVPPIKTLDLQDLARTKEGKNAPLIRAALTTCQIRPETPEHENKEGKLPTYDRQDPDTQMPYWEFSFLVGGGRLVVDTISGIIYAAMHYNTFYVLLDGGHRPAEAEIPLALARAQRQRVIRLAELGRRAERAARIAEREARIAAGTRIEGPPDAPTVYRILGRNPRARRAIRKTLPWSVARAPFSAVEAMATTIGPEAPRAAVATATATPPDGKEEKKVATGSTGSASRATVASSDPPAASAAAATVSADPVPVSSPARASRTRTRIAPTAALSWLASAEDSPPVYRLFGRKR